MDTSNGSSSFNEYNEKEAKTDVWFTAGSAFLDLIGPHVGNPMNRAGGRWGENNLRKDTQNTVLKLYLKVKSN